MNQPKTPTIQPNTPTQPNTPVSQPNTPTPPKNKIINSISSMKKTTIFLILILILAFILRLIAAINLPVTADDMHHVTYAINFYDADRLITYEQSSGLWHAFTSIIYNWLGTTQLASRMAALLFGSFSVLVIFLLTKEFHLR